MGMGDCEVCWSIPCCCGWGYRNYDAERLSEHIALITQYRTKEQARAIIQEALKRVDEIDNWQDDQQKNL